MKVLRTIYHSFYGDVEILNEEGHSVHFAIDKVTYCERKGTELGKTFVKHKGIRIILN